MSQPRMHADEWAIDAGLVRRLLGGQFPHWAELPLEPVASAGTDNALYRLGADLCVRLPRIPSASEQLAKEQAWLPVVAGRVPLDVPEQLAVGGPAEGFPWSWSVVRWLDGDQADPVRLTDQRGSAEALAAFIRHLQALDASDGPEPGRHNASRGVPLARRDKRTREGVVSMAGLLDAEYEGHIWDADLAMYIWDTAIEAPMWDRPGRWIHGDLHPGNVLATNGRISGVIDFGCLGVGDPAYDVAAAWTLFDRTGRDHFRTALDVDDATWRRAHGWALSFGVMVFPYYRQTNPGLVEIGLHTIAQALADASAG
ncbi:MAG: aminoglycoside phosphotransferase family protein [Acidimicrobiia bacterium]|nr:aminoglycoside phosphotransferase family protein [Acidimicrobiia bacterium]